MKRVVFLCLVFLISLQALAGSLEPSAAPNSTMKTLDEVEPRIAISSLPYTITDPGSYYVTDNLTCPANFHGITINADDVSIDLMGHTLTGQGAGTSIYNGIYTSSHKNIEIRNGAIQDFYQGIWINSSTSHACRIMDIRSSSNTGAGILIGGTGVVIKDCVVFDNEGSGISAGSN